MHKKSLFLFFFIFLLLINVGHAAKIVQQSEVGLDIEVSTFQLIPINTNYTLSFHVYNFSNGVRLVNNINCSIHIYDHNDGSHLLETDVPLIGDDFIIEFNDSLLYYVGDYHAMVDCENGIKGGFVSFEFNVGYSNFEPTTPDAIINSLLIFVLVIFFIVCLVFAFNTDGENKFTMGPNEERLVELNSGKYVKLFLYLLSYMFFWMLTWFIWITFENFMLSEIFTDVLKVLFIIETIFWVPIMIFVVVIGLVKHLTDQKVLNLAKRGLMPR